jgi:transcriptional regulator with XRE-family HTH domain
VDDIRIGRLLRALRRRRGLRQIDVARAAGVSQSLVSLVGRGHVASLSLASLRRIFAVVDARFEGIVTWRGGAIDRLLDEGNSELVESVAGQLARLGWDARLEVTFNEYGDRGSIDILGLLPASAIAVVVEVKTEITAVDETIRRLDVKERLAPKIVRDRLGWTPRHVSRLLVVLDTATNRRRVAAHEPGLGRAFPVRGPEARRWLRYPNAPVSALLFRSVTNQRGRIRRRGAQLGRSAAPGPPPTTGFRG